MESQTVVRTKVGLGLWICTALVVGNMIGSGIFLLPSSLAAYGGVSILGWLVTAAGAIFLALVFARLSRAIPKAGGPYAYSRLTFGDLTGFLMAWGYWISIWCSNAAIAIAMVGYLSTFHPRLATDPTLAASAAVAAIWVLTWVNSMGVRDAGLVQLVTTVLKIVPLIAIGVWGLFFLRPDHFTPFNTSGQSLPSAINATAALTLWAFLGLESATIPADEVARPRRTIPLATVLGTLIAAVVYILASTAVMGIIPPAALAKSSAPFADAAVELWGSWAGGAVAAGASIACFGALNGWILMQGQLPLAAARDGLFPESFGRVSRRGTPVLGIVISSVLATVLIAMNYRRGLIERFNFIIMLATLTCLVPYILSALAELVISVRGRGRTTGKDRPGGKKWVSGSIIAILALAYSVWAAVGLGLEIVCWGLLLLAAGVPVHGWIKWRHHRRLNV